MNILDFSIYVLIIMCAFIITIYISTLIINNSLVLKHKIYFDISSLEKFGTITGSTPKDIIEKADEPLKIIKTCKNESLNNLHNIGSIVQQPNQTMCSKEQTTEDGNKYIKRHAPLKMYDVDSDIMGANYMMYNSNPNPNHLDYSLYDIDEPKNEPVGSNYIK